MIAMNLPAVPPKALVGAWGGDPAKPLPVPFEQEIYLTHFSVAGTYYAENWQEAAAHMKPGERLSLLREPGNPHDTFAIQVVDAERRKLGYMPRRMNHIPARLLDAGKLLYVKVTEISAERCVLEVDLFMRE